MLKLDNMKDIDKKSVQSDKTECSSLVMSSDDVTDSDSARANNSITEGALNKTPDSIIDIQEDEIWSSASEAEDLIDDSEAAGENCDNSKGDLKPANNGSSTEDIDKIQSATTEENNEKASNEDSKNSARNDIVIEESRDVANAGEGDQLQGNIFLRHSAILIYNHVWKNRKLALQKANMPLPKAEIQLQGCRHFSRVACKL